MGQAGCCCAPSLLAHFKHSLFTGGNREAAKKRERSAGAGLGAEPALERREARLRRRRRGAAARQPADRARARETRRRKTVEGVARATRREFPGGGPPQPAGATNE